jgi:hypothetical protein
MPAGRPVKVGVGGTSIKTGKGEVAVGVSNSKLKILINF